MSGLSHQLPNGWTQARLGDVAIKIVDGSHNPPPRSSEGLPMLSARNVLDGEITFDKPRLISQHAFSAERTRVAPQPGDVLLTIVGTIGRAAVVRESVAPFALQRSVALIRPAASLSSKFCMLQLASQRMQSWLTERARGSAQQGIYLRTLSDLPIWIAPRDEQDRIVAEIEKQLTRLEAGVAALRRAQAKLKRYRAAVLKAACEGRLVTTEADLARLEGRDYESGDQLRTKMLLQSATAPDQAATRRSHRAKRAQAARNRTLPEIPEGWCDVVFEELLARFVDSAHRTPRYASVGVPALGPRDVVNGRLNLTNARRVNESEFAVQTARHRPEPGDVVFSRELSLGWAAELPAGSRVCLSQGMCLFRPHADLLTNYLLIVLNGPVGRQQSERAATGSAHPHINLGDIKTYRIPLPPLAEQHRIVAEVERRLSVIEGLEAAVAASLARAARLRQSILQRAFSGQLVPPEPVA
ncbi:MAG: restriction endonuclease subunit S [Candidatus Binatia bacterium]